VTWGRKTLVAMWERGGSCPTLIENVTDRESNVGGTKKKKKRRTKKRGTSTRCQVETNLLAAKKGSQLRPSGRSPRTMITIGKVGVIPACRGEDVRKKGKP